MASEAIDIQWGPHRMDLLRGPDRPIMQPERKLRGTRLLRATESSGG